MLRLSARFEKLKLSTGLILLGTAAATPLAMNKLLLSALVLLISFAALAQRGRQSTLAELRQRQHFMVELLARVQMQAILNHQMALSIRNCHINPRNNSEECRIVRETMLTPFRQVVADARMFLLLGYRDSVFGERYYNLNTGMSDLGTYKDRSWSDATSVETNAASGLLDRWVTQFSGEASRNRRLATRDQRVRYTYLKVRQMRVQMLEEYKAILSQIVLLQPFTASSVNPTNLRAALDTIVQRGAAELDTLKRAARIAENWMRDPVSCAQTIDYQTRNPSVSGDAGMALPTPLSYCIQTPPQLSALLDYRSIVEGLVTDFPEYQRVARSVESERTARSLGMAAMIAIPTLAVCIFAPPLVAIPAGAVAGGVALLQSQGDYNRVRNREISRVVNEAGDVDWEALKSARLMRNISVVLLPFFGAGRYIGPFARATASRNYLQGSIRLKRLILRRL